MDNFKNWRMPVEGYEARINALWSKLLGDTETNWRGLTGTISVPRDKMLCIAIPYDRGWTAYVDGQKVKLHQDNTAFMAVKLSAGNHKIELKYWTPGLTAGIALNCVGLAGTTVMIICEKKRTRSRKNPEIKTERDA